MSKLADKERRAIKILRMYRGNDPIEVSYSGGKDSDIILTLTKVAGNSIVVDVLYHIFRKMFCETHSENIQLTLF